MNRHFRRADPRPATAHPVGIWIRVSTEDQARGESPDHHERRARSYAAVRHRHSLTRLLVRRPLTGELP